MPTRLTVDGYAVTLHGDSWLPKLLGVHGITLGSHVFLRSPLQSVRCTLVGHEIGHVRQFAALGWLRFLWRYLREWWQHGYGLDMPLEADAQTYGMANWYMVEQALQAHIPNRAEV